MAEKIKVVFYGDAPVVATGFGKVSSNILPILHNTGDYDIEVFGVNYMGNPHNFPFKIYPMILNNQKDPYGRQKLQEMLPQLEFDILFMIQDSFILDFLPELNPKMHDLGKKYKSLVYFPIDGRPKEKWIKGMAAADQPITYTQWGRKQCVDVYPEIDSKLETIPHGVNPREFFPIDKEQVKELRKRYFGKHAEKFIVINVNRNQPRKDIPRSMMAFKEFQREVPNSVYYMHMAVQDFGWNLLEVAKTLDLRIGEDVLFPANFSVNQGFPVQVVNELYNCADVCISTCVGEGWGLSAIESLMTRTAAVFPDNTSLTEIFADGRGILARSGEHKGMWTIMPNDNEVLRPLTNIRDMVKGMKKVHDNPEFARQMAEKGYKWVHDNLIWEKHIVPKFDYHIKRLYAELKNPQMQMKATEEEAKADTNWKVGEMV